jgi:hypothetical protein
MSVIGEPATLVHRRAALGTTCYEETAVLKIRSSCTPTKITFSDQEIEMGRRRNGTNTCYVSLRVSLDRSAHITTPELDNTPG